MKCTVEEYLGPKNAFFFLKKKPTVLKVLKWELISLSDKVKEVLVCQSTSRVKT